jgi:hypothetical protein
VPRGDASAESALAVRPLGQRVPPPGGATGAAARAGAPPSPMAATALPHAGESCAELICRHCRAAALPGFTPGRCATKSERHAARAAPICFWVCFLGTDAGGAGSAGGAAHLRVPVPASWPPAGARRLRWRVLPRRRQVPTGMPPIPCRRSAAFRTGMPGLHCRPPSNIAATPHDRKGGHPACVVLPYCLAFAAHC